MSTKSSTPEQPDPAQPQDPNEKDAGRRDPQPNTPESEDDGNDAGRVQNPGGAGKQGKGRGDDSKT